ncbi:MAG: hemagglutinin repeat-containing protein [Sulfurovaceae bacterium]|nr:hemagglutinin repeat-containing protein [Sulfurovaceae bacterium]
MNHIFKTISKKIKGRANTTVVVSENASSLAKACDDRSAMSSSDTYSITLFSTIKQTLNLSLALFIFASSTLQADIIADTNAPTNTQPIILNTQSGATQVNIQTPTSSGISVNNYSQFDTGTNGTILNNSRTNANTVTAGWVEGNPFLATGSAKAIVNQVNSSNPSNLTGNIEIAGSKADLIIANPSGISIDGATIINAGTSTLTTGTPIINSGDLSGFSVNDGTVTIQGAGLNALGSDYTNILARSAIINAGIWSNELSIVTGVNTISRDNSNITAGTGATPAPLFAIDSSALGGMYANKINLIGTEAGVGVNNTGVVGANDNISIDINGKLTNSGTITSKGDISATTTSDIVNNNSISASKEVKLQSVNIDNTDGEITAGRLDISADNLNNTNGSITQAGIQDLVVNATNLDNSNDGLIGYEPIDSSGGVDTNSTTGGGSTGGGSTGGSTGGGTTTPTITLATGNINITNTLLNDDGKLVANGATTLNTTGTLTNSSTIDVENLNASGSSLNNDSGTINANNINVSTMDIINTNQIQSNSKTTINSSSMSGDGEIISNGDIDIDLANNYANAMKINGLNIYLDVIGELSNNGEITSLNTTSLKATDSITNRGLIDGVYTDIQTDTLNNFGTGRIYGDWVSIKTDTLNNTKENDKSAVIGAREELNIGANIINNVDGATILSMGDMYIGGSLDENGFAIGKAKEINNLSATIESGGYMSLASDEINNKTLTQVVKSVNTLNSDIVTFDEKYSQLSNGSIKTSYVVSDADVKSITSSLLSQYIQDGKTKQITISLEDSLDGYVLLNGKQYPIVNNPNIRYVRSSGSDKIYIVPNDIEIFIDEVTAALNEKYSKFDIEVHYTIPTPISQWVTFYKPDSGYRVDFSLYSEEKQREYSDITTEEYFSSLPTNPSLISSGGNLNISANNVTNYLSTILSAGDMKFDITDTLKNQSEVLYRYNEISGRFQYCYKECNDMFHSPNYTWAPLGIAQGSVEQIGSLNSVITAGGSITGNFGTLQNGMEANTPFTHQSSSVSENDTNGFTTGTPNTSLPNSSLFALNPDSPNYFIQTDPRFTNYKNFISSDYMLSQLSLDPTTLHKRLGDGYYEQKLVREQVMQLTGKRFLEGFNSDEEQYMALLNSGVEYMKSFDISVGVALSSEQMKNLTTDIILLVEKEVTLSDGTKTTALVPQLYTAASKVNTNGSLIAANAINVKVANNVINSGTMYSDTTIDITSDSLKNTNGSIRANDALNITTTNDIQNLSGSIEGSNVKLTSTNGSIINKTLTQTNTTEHEVGLESYTIVGEKATIIATGNNNTPTISNEQYNKAMAMPIKTDQPISKNNETEGSGNVVLNAKNDIVNSGANISATNSILLKAGNDIKIDTSVDGASHDFKLKNGYMKGESTTNITSNITSGEHIVIQSGNDITLKGANINAKETVALTAGSNLDILAAVDSDYDESKFVDKGSFGKKKTKQDMTLEQSVVSTNIDGKNVILDANDDITIQGSNIHATDNIVATTKEGDINVEATVYQESELHQIIKKGTFGLSRSMDLKSVDSQKLYESLLKTDTANIVLNSGKDINIIASNVDSASDVQLKAFDGLNILAGEELSSSTNKHESSKLNLLNLFIGVASAGLVPTGSVYTQTIKEKGNYDTDAKSSNIQAGGNIIADTGTTNIVGSNLEAGENIVISADTGGINITTAQELMQAHDREKEIDVKLSSMFDMVKSASEQQENQESSIKLKIATATYDDSKTDAKGVENVSSNLNAKNGSVILDSFDDISITGSNIKATDLLSLNSEIGNIDITNATDTKEVKNEETHGEADISVTVRNEYVEIATAIKNAAEAAEQLKDVKDQYSKYKKEVKKLENTLAQLKADYKNGVIGVDFEDIGDLEDLIDNVKDQEKYQIAAVAAATANLASANLAVAKQIATAAASSGTWGFNVGLALDVEGSKTKTNTSSTTSLASNLNADTIAMFTDNTMATHTTIQGSNIEASNLVIDTHDLNVLASQDTYAQEMDNKSINGSIAMTVYGAATGPNISLGYGEQHNNIDSTTNNNSNLLADNMLLNVSNDATFKGATVRADNLDMYVGNNLNVESLRDEYSSNSNGYNISVGTSFGNDSDYTGSTVSEQKNLNNTVGARTSSNIAGGNIGGGVNSGSTTSKQVVLTSITANNADITVGGNTNLKGSLIAAGYYDENGNFIDNGNLNLTTNTLTFSNLNSSSYSTNTSIGGGASLNQNKEGEVLPNASNVTYNASSALSYSASKTLATVGSGNLNITDKENSDDISKLNRDTSKINKELYSGGVSSDVSATIDMRMFTEDGRKDIAEDIKKAGMVVSTIEMIATNATVDATDFFKEVEKKDITYETIKQRIQTDPELAKVLSNPALSEEAKNVIINEVVSQVMIELGYTPTTNNLIATTEAGRDGLQIKGFYSLETGEGYINDLYNLSNYDLLSTAGTETQRAIDAINGWDFSDESLRGDRSLYAQDFGNTIADYTDFILSQNDYGSLSTTINPIVTSSDTIIANNAEFAALNKVFGDNEGSYIFANPISTDKEEWKREINRMQEGVKSGVITTVEYTKILGKVLYVLSPMQDYDDFEEAQSVGEKFFIVAMAMPWAKIGKIDDAYDAYKEAKAAGDIKGMQKAINEAKTDITLFRGGNKVTIRPRDVDYNADGLVDTLNKQGKPQGLSVNIDPNEKYIQSFGGAFPVNSLPDGLVAIQSGKAGHYVIAPAKPMTLDAYQQLLNKIDLGKFNKLP